VSIKCGNCKTYHNTVAEVRVCFGATSVSGSAGDFINSQQPEWDWGGDAPLLPPMTQLEEDLEIQRREREEDRRVAEYKSRRDSRDLSGFNPSHIGGNRSMPSQTTWATVNKAAEGLPNIKSVHYAIRNPDGEFRFYRVDKPQSGRWAGKTFIKVQASDEYHRLSSGPVEQLRIINEILVDPRKAAEDYGHEIGSCAICNRTLTDPESIERGIGPICAGKEGW
jgi:hypothetical protein